jgi:hypothetical protein
MTEASFLTDLLQMSRDQLEEAWQIANAQACDPTLASTRRLGELRRDLVDLLLRGEIVEARALDAQHAPWIDQYIQDHQGVFGDHYRHDTR